MTPERRSGSRKTALRGKFTSSFPDRRPVQNVPCRNDTFICPLRSKPLSNVHSSAKIHGCMQNFKLRTHVDIKSDGGSVTVWEVFTWHDSSSLVNLDKLLTGKRYIRLLGDDLLPFVTSPQSNDDDMLRDDNAPGHWTYCSKLVSGDNSSTWKNKRCNSLSNYTIKNIA